MAECVFCKIVAGEVPCEKVYEDDAVVAFLDIHPVNKGHVLVVPKEHTQNLFTASHPILEHLIGVAQKIASALSTYADGVNIGQNNNRAAGQVVEHLHFHVIPRFANDGLRHWPGKTYREGEAQNIARQIKKLLGIP